MNACRTARTVDTGGGTMYVCQSRRFPDPVAKNTKIINASPYISYLRAKRDSQKASNDSRRIIEEGTCPV